MWNETQQISVTHSFFHSSTHTHSYRHWHRDWVTLTNDATFKIRTFPVSCGSSADARTFSSLILTRRDQDQVSRIQQASPPVWHNYLLLQTHLLSCSNLFLLIWAEFDTHHINSTQEMLLTCPRSALAIRIGRLQRGDASQVQEARKGLLALRSEVLSLNAGHRAWRPAG